jgi:hypothetical protein
MKSLVVIVFILIGLRTSAQHVASTFQAAEQGEYSMQKLDAVYPSAISSNDKAVFKGPQQDKFIIAIP